MSEEPRLMDQVDSWLARYAKDPGSFGVTFSPEKMVELMDRLLDEGEPDRPKEEK